MNIDYQIPEPILLNPVKHHLGYIKEYIDQRIDSGSYDSSLLGRELRHLGSSVMDVYTGSLTIPEICNETIGYLETRRISDMHKYAMWIGASNEKFRIYELSDKSAWTMKYHDDPLRYVHIFPARNSDNTFRVRSNSLKSALIYCILIGKDMVTAADLNKVRPILGLPPVKDPSETEAILEIIEILRN